MEPEDLKKTPTEQLIAELLDRGCIRVDTRERPPYQPGYRLIKAGYGRYSLIKAQIVLVVPPFTFE